MSIEANWARCTSCHVGYGWQDASFDFSDKTKVDCLVCHDTTGKYKKKPTTAGLPDPSVDLLYVARHVGPTSRQTCGNCHFFGGGGDAIKHGDLDSSLFKGSRNLDVHMGTDGADFTCQECHKTESHAITGNAMVATPANTSHIGCTGCHDEKPHDETLLNDHMDSIACQTCHIPEFAREMPTKLEWDWSTAGQEKIEPETDEYGKAAYHKKKGNFVWGKNVIPTYAWYNGKGGAYLLGDKIDPKKVTKLSWPEGNRKDMKAKIYPFKLHKGKQIYDKKNNYLVTPKVFGKKGDPDAFWVNYDWQKAATAGMKASGLEFSGEYGFAPTEMYWRINHMVVPAEQALKCLDCHGDGGRMDWQALGYKADPMRNRKAARTR